MAWVATHSSGEEGMFLNKPLRGEFDIWWDTTNSPPCSHPCSYPCFYSRSYDTEIPLPKGSIKKLIGRDLTWEDNLVELKEE